MKIKKEKNTTKIWLSRRETFKWSRRPNAQWPCSTLSDKRVFIELDNNKNIVDVIINGKHPSNNIDTNELSCILKDLGIK